MSGGPTNGEALRAPELVTTARLVARRLQVGDEPRFHEFHLDREVVYWLDPESETAVSPAENREWLERHLGHWAAHGFGLYAVFERDVRQSADEDAAGLTDERFVGRAALTVMPDDVAELAGAPGAVELGYALARRVWGCGYATEIGARLLDVARDDLGLAEVVAYTMATNARSRRTLERLGFVADAGEFVHDGMCDVFYRRRLDQAAVHPPGARPGGA